MPPLLRYVEHKLLDCTLKTSVAYPSDNYCLSLSKKELTYVFQTYEARLHQHHLWHFQTSTSELSAVRCLLHAWEKLPHKHQQIHFAIVIHNLVPIQTKSRVPQCPSG